MCRVSVIIPVYNEEQYLRECLDSVCAQTMKDIEIICVDDGSTDASCDILEEYVRKDNRVSVYHQQNQFAGIARNNGLGHATGEYIAFLDCDDFFAPDNLECMYNQAKKMDADICVCKANRLDETYNVCAANRADMVKARVPESNLFNIHTNSKYILNFTNTVIWTKLFRRAFLERENLRFPAHRNAEDAWFTWIALCRAERITTVDRVLMTHRVRSATSEVGKLDTKDPTISFRAYCEVADYLKENGIFPEQSFENRIMDEILNMLRHFKVTENQRKAIEFLKEQCMDTLSIQPREPGYYYRLELEEAAAHLIADTPEEFQGYLNFSTKVQLSLAKLRLSKEKEKNERLQAKLDAIYALTPKRMVRKLSGLAKKIKGTK